MSYTNLERRLSQSRLHRVFLLSKFECDRQGTARFSAHQGQFGIQSTIVDYRDLLMTPDPVTKVRMGIIITHCEEPLFWICLPLFGKGASGCRGYRHAQ